MRYRIVHAYPKGYAIQKRRFFFFWFNATVNRMDGSAWVYEKFSHALDAIVRLERSFRPLTKMEIESEIKAIEDAERGV